MGKINCFHCARKCKGDVLKVNEKYFHKECFTCKVCHKKLDDTGFFSKDDYFYCPDDYKKHCAAICFFCQEKIVGEVVTALSHTFHKICFKCSVCQKNFLPGDKVSMKNADFLCSTCSIPYTNRSITELKNDIKSQMNTKENSIHPVNEKPLHHRNNVDLNNQIKDTDSFSVPIKRKIVTNKTSINYQPLANNLHRPVSSHSTRNRLPSGDENNMDFDNSYGHSLTTPKHFHVPPGNNRYWMYNSMIVGSKNHPLALSAGNINKLSSSSQKINETDSINKDNVIKLSSYPSGNVHRETSAIERQDWPAPPAVSVLMNEKNRKKIQNPTVEALSAGTTPKIRKARTVSQGADINHNSSKVGIAEVIKRSTTDISSYDKLQKVGVDEIDIPKDPISASRSPSAVCEPLVPPRYDIHTETSPSRNDDFYKQTERHLGYSMDFVNSTSRSFASDNTLPKYRKSLRNSYVELRQVSHNGSVTMRGNGASSGRNEYHSINDKQKYHSAILPMESDSLIISCIPYNQLRISNRRIIKHLDRSRLETYISDDEFHRLFNLSRPAFYQLPEWKRNDLKKQVDLF